MVAVFRRLIHAYPNTALFSLGFLLVVIPEATSKAVFYTHFGILYLTVDPRNWTSG